LWATTGKAKCDVCKTTTWTVRETLGNKYVEKLIVDFIIFGCGFFIEDFGFDKSTCPGIIKQQVGDSIYPIVTEQLFAETTMCSYILNVCDMDKYEIEDSEAWVFNVVGAKTPLAATNNYINTLYE
jgi:hypothetical protein